MRYCDLCHGSGLPAGIILTQVKNYSSLNLSRMKKNMRKTDRVIRLLLVIVLVTIYKSAGLSGFSGMTLIGLSTAFFTTGFYGVCPFYSLFRLNTYSSGKVWPVQNGKRERRTRGRVRLFLCDKSHKPAWCPSWYKKISRNNFDAGLKRKSFKHKTEIMKTNMGNADRMIRVVVALLISVLYITGVLTGTLAIVLLIVAGVFFLTSLFGICPLYSLLGINSCPAKKVWVCAVAGQMGKGRN